MACVLVTSDNPKQVNKVKKTFPKLPNNDPVDAIVTADNLRLGRITKSVLQGQSF